jgi:hypothetical protein
MAGLISTNESSASTGAIFSFLQRHPPGAHLDVWHNHARRR